jgi:hypothetical protein
MRVLQILEKVAALEGGDPSAREIDEFLDQKFGDMTRGMRKKIELLARGLTPPEDFRPDDCLKIIEHKPSKITVELGPEHDDLQAGDLIFYAGKRWLLVSRTGRELTLKQI